MSRSSLLKGITPAAGEDGLAKFKQGIESLAHASRRSQVSASALSDHPENPTTPPQSNPPKSSSSTTPKKSPREEISAGDASVPKLQSPGVGLEGTPSYYKTSSSSQPLLPYKSSTASSEAAGRESSPQSQNHVITAKSARPWRTKRGNK